MNAINPMNRLALSSWILALLIGCSNKTDPLGAQDAGVAPDMGQVEADAGFADMGVEPDAGPPPRTLVERKLFGTSPVDNRVLDPNFDLRSRGWFAFTSPVGGQPQFAEVTVKHFAKTPTGQPVLTLPGLGASSPTVALGNVKAGGPMSVSLWVGRRIEAGVLPAGASVVGVGARGQSLVIDLLEASDSTVEMGEMVWVRYEGLMPEATVGWLSILVFDVMGEPLYLSGVVAQLVQQASLGPKELGLQARPLKRHELDGLKLFKQMLRDGLGKGPQR